jgi:plasmid stabilization system protein ParE
VARVVYSAGSLTHLEQAVASLRPDNPGAAAAAAAISSAVAQLAAHPLIGRPIDAKLRALVISHGKTGYVALYRFVVPRDEVRVLAIRYQSAIGFIP